MNKQLAVLTLIAAASAAPAYPQAKNIILFIGDGAGISSLNAASIYGYGKPQALYVQKMPHLALADTSTAREWVTDGAACASAWATGHKGRNGVVSMSPDAEKDVKDGEIYKTVMEYAMEQGLSTGVISNDGVAGAAVAAFYAHHNNRGKAGEIFQQALNPKFGKGPDVIIGTGRKQITDQTTALGHNLAADIKARNYTFIDSVDGLSKLDQSAVRVIALTDDGGFDFDQAVQQAVARLSKNPKGFILVAHSDCHTGKTRTSLQRLVDLDKAVATAAEARRRNIRFIAYNTRFLILPWIRVPHLASHILGRVTSALPGDWERMYSHPVYFAETFIDPGRFRGTCYRAANWVLMGRTTGRGKASNSYTPNRSIKEVLGLALTRRFRELLSEWK